MRVSSALALAVIFFSFLGAVTPVTGKTIYVDDDGPADFNNIQAAIDDCNDGDVVIATLGAYTCGGNRDIDFKGKAITVQSANPQDPFVVDKTVIDIQSTFDEPHYGFLFHSGEDANSILAGFTITNSLKGAEPIVGAIGCRDSSPTITNCTITSIRTYQQWDPEGTNMGSAINIVDGNPIIIGCTLTNNRSDGFNGAAGGAIYNEGGNPTLINCNFAINFATCGGGMSTGHGHVTLINCIFDRNHAEDDGGGLAAGGTITLINCLFIRNLVGMWGGGIFTAGETIITNCTFADNFADHGGMAVYNWKGRVKLTNSILWLDPNAVWYGYQSQISVEGGEISITYSDVQGGWPGEGNIDMDPCWVNGDYHLKSQGSRWNLSTQAWVKDDVTSLCIDAGDPMSPIGFELFPNGGRINMGAYGGTAEASKSYFGEPVCETIVTGDINGDCIVDWLDFAILSLHWLQEPNQ